MCWQRRLEEAVAWAEEMWNGLSPATRKQVFDTIDYVSARLFDPYFFIDLAAEEIEERLRAFEARAREYARQPERLRTEFIEYILPGSRYGELARMMSPGSELIEGLGEEVSRPVILVPGMVGTRLFRTGEGSRPRSSTLPPDEIAEWFERELRSDDSEFLRRLPASVREVLRPALIRLSDRHLYNPATIWDPDTKLSLFHLTNKTATERGALFCPDDTPGEPATDFSATVAESMTLRGVLSFWLGRDWERRARELAQLLDVSSVDGLLEDARFEALRQRRKDRGWCQPVWDVSEHWLMPMERAFGEVIYVFGYDWRQPLSNSVGRLVRKIERVKEAHGGKSPILVTHSFGGLVARAAAKRRPENVGGIVQAFSPTAGSVKMYTNFKKGGGGSIPPGWQSETPADEWQLSDWFDIDMLTSLMSFDPMDAGFAILLGWDENAFAATSAGVYGAYSLLPNNLPRFGARGHWLNIENDAGLASVIRSSRNVYDLYRQFDRPWGLLDGSVWRDGASVLTGDESERAWAWLATNSGRAGSLVSWLHSLQRSGYMRVFTRETLNASQVRTVRERVLHGIEQAEQLNASVGAWVHPNTWSIDGTGRATDVGFNIRRTDSGYATRRIVSTEGDGSLELASARSLSEAIPHQLHFNDVSHAHAMGENAQARNALVKAVYLAMVAAYRAER
jgi:pimeloyl-ACP methyl ester carboxylesterase